ncbi:MAG TPA: alpha/beta hydrolase [Methylomirabilota bacterium]|nr:alpha/beta hydrolase [Methylomirabilota bacterium]
MATATLKREEFTVNGVKIVQLTAGKGEPLVFFHGAGTFHGFDFALPWAEQYRVVIPFHPGFGESDDDPKITEMHDYVIHYLEWMDQLGLGKVNLVGFSLGGWMAAAFASEHAHRLKRLVLIAPAGLRVPEHPIKDLFRVPGEQIPAMLVHNFEVIRPHLPTGPDVDFLVARYRETSSLARIAWDRPYDLKLPRRLHRIKVPTLIVWGEQDQVIPVEQSDAWAKLIPGAKVKVFQEAGHLVLDEKPEALKEVAAFLV